MRETAWWAQKDLVDQANSARQFAEALRSRQHYERRARAEAALFLYSGSTRLSLSGASWQHGLTDEDVPPFFNLIQTAVDWFTSMMVRNRIRPYFLTEGGNNELQEKAKCAGRAVEGLMRQLGIWDELGMLRCQDGHLFEAGGIKYAADLQNRRIVASRVRPWEFFVAEREARLGRPTQFVHDQTIERSVLAAMLPADSEEREIVMEAEPEDIDPVDSVPGDHSDLVLTHELWHLPSGRVDLKNPLSFGLDDNGDPTDADPGHDGRRVIVMRNGIIVSEPWPYDYVPISWYKPRRDPVGYWSRSIPETLAGAQLELMDIGQKIQSIMRRHAVPHLLLWKQAKVNTQQITNDHAAILETQVPPAQAAFYLTPQAVPAELFSREAEIIRWAEKQLGVSEMSLAGVKPPSIEHAPGMEHLAEMEMIRHTAAFHAFERAHLEDARVIIDLLRMLAQHDPNMEVIFGESKQLERFKVKDFDMEREQYHLKVWPTNLFAQTPTAKFRQIKEFYQAGLFDDSNPQARKALRAMGFADVEEVMGDQVAEIDNIEKRLQLAVEGKPDHEWIPTPDMDLAAAKLKSKARINRLEADGEEPEAIDRVRTFWMLADRMEKEATASAAAATQGVAPPEGGAPPPDPNAPAAPPMAA